MTDTATRVVSFAGSSVQIEAVGPDAVHIVAFLFGRLPSVEGPLPHATLRVQTDSEGGAPTLHRNGQLFCQRASAGGIAAALLDQTVYELSDRSQGGLLLHAAAVSWGDRCIVLPAKTGAGKTSLTAWLLKQGFGYLTDEMVYLPFGSMDIQPFVRPLNMKASARSTIGRDVVDFESLAPKILSSPEESLVPADTLGQEAGPGTGRLGSLVFPQYLAGASLRAETLSQADTGMRLMAGLINARNLPGHGFSEVTRLARSIPATDLDYGAFSQLETWVGRLRTREAS